MRGFPCRRKLPENHICESCGGQKVDRPIKNIYLRVVLQDIDESDCTQRATMFSAVWVPRFFSHLINRGPGGGDFPGFEGDPGGRNGRQGAIRTFGSKVRVNDYCKSDDKGSSFFKTSFLPLFFFLLGRQSKFYWLWLGGQPLLQDDDEKNGRGSRWCGRLEGEDCTIRIILKNIDLLFWIMKKKCSMWTIYFL